MNYSSHIPAGIPAEYTSLAEFYAADMRRELSGESDYGVHWHGPEKADFPCWRVSYIQSTGEVYALELGSRGRVLVLGTIPPDTYEPGRKYYQSLDNILFGWADACLDGEPVTWVRDRLPKRPAPTLQV